MYFTTEDYKKIERWLQLRTKKDSDFRVAKTLTGKENIPILQDNENKLTTINELKKGLTINNITDFFNVTAYNNADYSSLIDAVVAIPNNAKKVGLVISYRKDNAWYIVQYRGKDISTWEDTTYWDDLFTGIHKDIEYLYKEVNTNTTSIEDINSNINTLGEKVSDNATDIGLLKDNADSTGKKLKEVSELTEQALQATVVNDTNIGTLNKNLKSTNDRIDAISTKVDSNTSNISTIQQQVKTLKEDHNSLKSDVATNATNISGNTTSINTLTSDLNSTKTDINTLKTTVSAIGDKQKTIGDQVVTNTGDVDKLKAQVKSLKDDQTSMKGDISTNSTNISSNTTSIGTLNTAIESTNKEVGTLKTTTAAISDKQKVIGDQVVINTDDISTLKTQVKDLQDTGVGDLSALTTKVNTNTTDIGLLKDNAEATGTKLKEIDSTLDSKVSKVSGEKAIVVTTGTTPKVSLNLDNTGNVTLSQSTTGLKASVTIPSATVTGVKTGDKVITLDGTELSTTIAFSVDSAVDKEGKKYLRLTGVNGVDLGKVDIASFVKDGMLSNASFNDTNHKLTLTFNTDAGKEAIEVNLSSLVDVYDGSKIKLTAVTLPASYTAPAKGDSVDVAIAKLTKGKSTLDAAITDVKKVAETAANNASTAITSSTANTSDIATIKNTQTSQSNALLALESKFVSGGDNKYMVSSSASESGVMWKDVSELATTKELTKVSDKVSSNTTKLGEVNTTVSTLKTSVETNTENIGLVSANIDSISKKLKEHDTSIESNTSSISSIKTEQTTQNNNITNINTRLTPSKSGQYLKGGLKQGILTTYWEDVDFASSSDLDALKETVDTNSTNISTNTTNIAKVKLTAEGAEQSAADVAHDLELTDANVSTISTDLGNVKTRVTNAESTIKTHTNSINSTNTKITNAETAANKTTNVAKSTTIAGFIANVDSKIGTLSTGGGSSLPSPDRVNQVFMSDYNAEGTLTGQWKDFNMDEVIGYGIKFKNSLLPSNLPTTYPAGNQSQLAELPVEASMKACVYRPKTKELMYWLDPDDWGFAEGVKDNFFTTGISLWKQKMWSTLSEELGCTTSTTETSTQATPGVTGNPKLYIRVPLTAVDATASRFFVGMKVRAWQYKTTGIGLSKKKELEGMIGESKIIAITDSAIYIDKQLLGTQLDNQTVSTGLTIVNAKLAKATTIFEWGSRLDGYDGEVMIYVPTFYIKGIQDSETNMRTVLVAPQTSKYYDIIDNKGSGWNKVVGFMVSAYLCTTLNESPGSDMGYLSTFTSYPVPLSIKNTSTYCRGGADGEASSKDMWLSSYPEFTDLGKPINGLIRSKIRDAAQSNAKTTLMTYEVFRSLLYLYAIERKDILFSNLVTVNTDIPYRLRYQTIPPIGYLNSFASNTISTSVPTHAWDTSGDGYDNNPSNVPSTTKNYKVNKFRGLEYPIEVGHYMLDDYSYNSNTKIFQALTKRSESNSFLESRLDYNDYKELGWRVETSNVEATTSTKKFTAFLDDDTHLSILPASTVTDSTSGRSTISIAQGTMNTSENNVVNIGTIYDGFLPFSTTVTSDGVVPNRGGYFRTMVWQITIPQIALQSDDTTID